MRKRVRVGLLWCSVVLICALGAQAQFVQQQKLVPPIRQARAQFGWALAVHGSGMVVGSKQETNYRGAAYVYEKSGETWSQTARLTAANPVQGDSLFGSAVAIAGNTLVVGGNKAVYVFEKNGNVWTQTHQLVTPDGFGSDGFGYALILKDNTLVVSAPSNPIGANPSDFVGAAGAVFFYEKGNAGWTQTHRLVASDRAFGDSFGSSLSLDGNRLAVGAFAHKKDAAGADSKDNAGAVYIFEKNGSAWTQTQKLAASDRAAFDFFGSAVVFVGGELAVGAPGQSTDEAGKNFKEGTGAVYLFKKTGSTWNQTQKLVGGNRLLVGGAQLTGRSLAASENILVVSSLFEGLDANNSNLLPGAGTAYVFENNGQEWVQSQKLMASDRGESDVFGSAVGIYGKEIMVGARGQEFDNDGNNKNDAGAVYIFSRAPMPPPSGTPTLSVNTGILSGFVTNQGSPSAAQSFTLSASGFGASTQLVIDASPAYEASPSGQGPFSKRIFFTTDASGNLQATVYVRLNASAPLGTANDVLLAGVKDQPPLAFVALNGVVQSTGNTDNPPPPPTTDGCALTKVRIFPRPDCCSGRTIGGQIQVSTEGRNGPWQTVLTVDREVAGQWNEFAIDAPSSLKAIRYRSPDWGYGNVAEVEFYNGTTKLAGTIFDDGSGPWNGNQDRTASKAFDGNTQTYYDANNANGAFVGIELSGCTLNPPPATDCGLTRIDVLPRQKCCAGRTIGGKFQVSTVGQEGPWETVLTLSNEPASLTNYYLPNGGIKGPIKAIRYLAPDWSYGNVAELTFYSGDKKLTGTVFHDGSGPWNGLQDRSADKAFDSDPATFYDANNANGAYVGLELTGCPTGNARLAAPGTAEATWALHVAPNPSAGRVKASVTLPQATRFTLTLTNVLGQELHRREVPGEAGANPVEVDFSAQPTGLYLLRVQTDGQKPLVQKLLKRSE